MYPAQSITGTLELGLGKGSVRKGLVARPLLMGSSLAQPEKETWVCPHVGSSLTGGAIEVQCNVDRVGVKGRGFGSPIPGC